MTTVHCPLCKSTGHTPIDATVRFAENTKAVRCDECELTYLWPQPAASVLNEFYAKEYRSLYDTTTVAERHKEDATEALLRISRLGSLLTQETRLLEIGSGSCAFLKAVSAHIAEAVGIEPDQKTRDWIAGTDSVRVHADLPSVPKDAGPFDVIVMFHVLEHLPDPGAFLTDVAEHLSPNGHLVIEVPNIDDALLSLYDIQAFRDFYFSIAHLTYFNAATLTRCAEIAKFQGTVSGVQRYDLSNHLTWALTGRPGGGGAFTPTLSPATNESYAKDLVENDMADTLWGIFSKG